MLDENELLIVLDNWFGFFEIVISFFNIFEIDWKVFFEDFYEGFKNFFGMSLVDGCFLVSKNKGNFLKKKLFGSNLDGLVDYMDGYVLFKLE